MKTFLMIPLFFGFATSLCAEDVTPGKFTFTREDFELGRTFVDGFKKENEGAYDANDDYGVNNLDETMYFITLAQFLKKEMSVDERNAFRFNEEEFSFDKEDFELSRLLLEVYMNKYNLTEGLKNKHNLSDDQQLPNIIGETMHFIDLAQRMQACAKNPTDECNQFHLDEIEQILKNASESETTKKLSVIIESLKSAKISAQSDKRNVVTENKENLIVEQE